MNNYSPKPGDWVRNYTDNGSILWAGENVSTILILDNDCTLKLRPYTAAGHPPATDAQAQHAEAVLRASEHCPNPWPGQVDELPEGGLPGYWRDKDGDVWCYQDGYWHIREVDAGWTDNVMSSVFAPFTPTVLPEDAKPLETPQDSESEDVNEDSEVSDQELADLRDEATLFKSLSVKLWRDINEMAVELEEVREELRIARGHRSEIRSTIRSMSVGEIVDLLTDKDLPMDDEGN